jgi:hypothetical protein
MIDGVLCDRLCFDRYTTYELRREVV